MARRELENSQKIPSVFISEGITTQNSFMHLSHNFKQLNIKTRFLFTRKIWSEVQTFCWLRLCLTCFQELFYLTNSFYYGASSTWERWSSGPWLAVLNCFYFPLFMLMIFDYFVAKIDVSSYMRFEVWIFSFLYVIFVKLFYEFKQIKLRWSSKRTKILHWNFREPFA